MQPRTVEYFIRMPISNLTAHVAFRAIMRAVGKADLLKAYHVDLAIDAEELYRHSPTKFVYILRNSGSHLWHKADKTLTLPGILAAVGSDAKFYTYDEDRVDPIWGQPELQEVTAEEMVAFLQQIGAERTEKRYLTPTECHRIAIRIMSEKGSDCPLVGYFADMTNHPTANGQCHEVSLTQTEAREVDVACEFLGIG